MERATSGIDVAAVGLDVDEIGGDAAILEDQRSNGTRRAIGAVHQHPQAAEIHARYEIGEPLRVLLSQLAIAGQHF